MTDSTQTASNDRLVRRTEARKTYLGNISASTEWRRLRTDPQFPKLSADGLHYRLSDLLAYIAVIGAQRPRSTTNRDDRGRIAGETLNEERVDRSAPRDWSPGFLRFP